MIILNYCPAECSSDHQRFLSVYWSVHAREGGEIRTCVAEAEVRLVGCGGDLAAHLLHDGLDLILVLLQFTHSQQLHARQRLAYK